MALKFLPEALARNPEARGRFLTEAKSAAALDHPYICKIYEIGDVDGEAFIAMEFIDGVTLQEKLASGPLRLPQLLNLGAEIAEAVEAAHRKQIVHRDLKSPNIMVTSDGHVKVLDFGLAKKIAIHAISSSRVETFSGRRSSDGAAQGTVIYMSPEQVRGEDLDSRTDIFSLGVVLYEMATGDVPFQGATSGLTYDAILNRGPAAPSGVNPDVPEELSRTILKSLQKEREQRYQSASALLVDLRRLKRDTLSPKSDPGVKRFVSSAANPVSSAATGRGNHSSGGLWGLAALGAAVLIGLTVLLLKPNEPNEEMSRASIHSLAVLPFSNARDDPAIEYLGDGIAESLINRLSSLPQLEVMARSTAFRYRGAQVDPRMVGRDLSVGAVLSGRVVQQGETLNVQAELVDVESGMQIWGEQYNRELADMVAVQNEIAQEISRALRLQLTGAEIDQIVLEETTNPDAYRAFLKGQFFWNKRTSAGLRKAIQFYDQAKTLEPGYALPYVGLANSHLLLGAFYGGADTVPAEEMTHARRYAQEALRLDPGLAEAHVSLAYIAFLHDWDWALAEAQFRRAIELDADYAVAHQWYSEFLMVMGRHQEAIFQATRALELEPSSPILLRELGLKYLIAEKYPEAIDQFLLTLELDSGFAGTHDMLIDAYWYAGRMDDVIEDAELLNDPLRRFYQAAARGGREEAIAIVGELTDEDASVAQRSGLYALVEEKDKALDLMEEAVQRHMPQILLTQARPAFDVWASDPRLRELRKKMGL